MASNPKIDSKPVVENKANPEPVAKSRKGLILIGSGILVLLLGAAAFWGISHYRSTKASSQDGNAEAKGKAPQSVREEIKGMLPLDPFLVNLADTDANHFVKATFQLGLTEDIGEKGEEPSVIAAIRDSIITLLSSKTAEQILTPQGKDQLREEILKRVKAVAPQINAVEVYIVDFVVQL